MYTKIEFKGLAASKLFGYAAAVPFFKGRKTLELKPGLNILFGPNGCGKSTVLSILGLTMAATQGGVSTVTPDHVSSTVDMMGVTRRDAQGNRKPMGDKIGVSVWHDGQPVMFSDPRKTVGLMGGAFDDDFMQQGLQEAMSASRRSHGQQSMSRGNAALAALLGKMPFPEKVSHAMRKNDVNDVWGEALDLVASRMSARIPVGQRTVILDEPEANFSLVWQSRLWALLGAAAVARDFQVIVASHSPFALGIAHANYIEFEPGYREAAQSLLANHFSVAEPSARLISPP